MVLKTFNLDEEVYKEFSKYCKKNGISMSKKVGNFIKEEVDKLKGRKEKRSKRKNSTVNVERHSFSKFC